MMAMGRKRGSDSTAPSVASSPVLDSSSLATSPEDTQAADAVLRTLAVSQAKGSSLNSCPIKRAAGTVRDRKGLKSKGIVRGETEGPPEVKVQQHGRGGGKEDGWRSMHMVQRLRYHEVHWNTHGCS